MRVLLATDGSKHAEHAASLLVDFAERHGSDLLVLGNTGQGLLTRFLMGSTSRFAIRHARCSVWIARRQTSC